MSVNVNKNWNVSSKYLSFFIQYADICFLYLFSMLMLYMLKKKYKPKNKQQRNKNKCYSWFEERTNVSKAGEWTINNCIKKSLVTKRCNFKILV